MKTSYLLIFILMIAFSSNYAQILTNYEPCLTGSENSCKCNSSPIICTLETLNGLTYKMTNFLHPGDGPGNPMCLGFNGTTAHNPSWIRFIAWCEEIDLEVITTNCSGSVNCPSRGVQLAVFLECNWQNPENAVACEVDHCLNTAPWGQNIPVKMTNLKVGSIYSLLLDGCCNSACDVLIKVLPNSCVRQNVLKISGLDSVVTQTEYLYKLDFPKGTKILTVIQDSIETQINTSDTSTFYMYKTQFNKDKTSTLCIKSDFYCDHNTPVCKIITVLKPNAGKIIYTNKYYCPSDSINIMLDSTQKHRDFINFLVISDSTGIVKYISDQNNFKILNKTCERYKVNSFNFLNIDTSYVQIGDSIIHLIKKCDSSICAYTKKLLELKNLNIPPTFINPPLDITLSCSQGFENVDLGLAYSNNLPEGLCKESGVVNSISIPIETGCNSIHNFVWIYSNTCHTIEHNRLISVFSNEAKFINPPKDTTIECKDIDKIEPSFLFYSNNDAGLCNLSGQVVPITISDIVECFGYILRTWEYIEPCGRIITHTQKINVVNTSSTNDLEKEIVVKTSLHSKTLLIELNNNSTSRPFKMTNIEGKVIFFGDIENKTEIDISSFTSGIYFFTVNTIKNNYTHKIFIP
jgi:hypothetical protein